MVKHKREMHTTLQPFVCANMQVSVRSMSEQASGTQRVSAAAQRKLRLHVHAKCVRSIRPPTGTHAWWERSTWLTSEQGWERQGSAIRNILLHFLVHLHTYEYVYVVLCYSYHAYHSFERYIDIFNEAMIYKSNIEYNEGCKIPGQKSVWYP